MWKEAWRIFEVDKATNKPKTLFHPHEGSRFLLTDTPLKAYQGIVNNPGKKTQSYRAGWHVGLNKESIIKYLDNFTADRKLCVCRVWVKDTRPKPRSRSDIQLAKHMIVWESDWIKAT